MAVCDEELAELRAQLLPTGHGPRGIRAVWRRPFAPLLAASHERLAPTGHDDSTGTELAWRPNAAPGKRSEAARHSSPAGRRILVVDDNEDAAEMLALVLRKRGYEVDLAFDGEDALVVAEARQPEIVLLDIGLPGIDGYEVARRLRARASGTEDGPMLVAVTGYGQPGDRQRSREAGFDHHLVKPVAMDTLLPLLGDP